MARVFFSIVKLLFVKDAIGNLIFYYKLLKKLFTSKEFGDFFKNRALFNKLKMAQDKIAEIQRFIPNEITEMDIKRINKDCTDVFKGFYAELCKDKYGAGNDGINLGLTDSNIYLGASPYERVNVENIGPFKIESD